HKSSGPQSSDRTQYGDCSLRKVVTRGKCQAVRSQQYEHGKSRHDQYGESECERCAGPAEPCPRFGESKPYASWKPDGPYKLGSESRQQRPPGRTYSRLAPGIEVDGQPLRFPFQFRAQQAQKRALASSPRSINMYEEGGARLVIMEPLQPGREGSCKSTAS